jgi:hypothetical protein
MLPHYQFVQSREYKKSTHKQELQGVHDPTVLVTVIDLKKVPAISLSAGARVTPPAHLQMPRAESKGDDDSHQEEKGCKGDAQVPRVTLLSLDVSPNHCGVSEVSLITLRLTGCINHKTATQSAVHAYVSVRENLVRCSC